MKKAWAIWLVILALTNSKAQLSFTLPATTCVNSTLLLSANTGTMFSPQLTWLASPNAVFSSSTSANTSLSFTSSGTYTVLLVAISGTMLASAQGTVQVITSYTPVLSSSSSSVCPSGSFTLTSTTSTLGPWQYTFGLVSGAGISTGTMAQASMTAPASLPAIFGVTVGLAGCSGMDTLLINERKLYPLLIPITNSVCLGYASTLTTFGGYFINYTYSSLTPTPQILSTGSQSIAVSPTVPTVYQVMVDSATCVGTASINIGISPPLNIIVTASSPTTCIINNSPILSKPVTLQPYGAANYIWTPPIITNTPGVFIVRPLSTTCFTAVGYTAVCSGTAVVCVSMTPQFSMSTSPAQANICLGQTITLSVNTITPTDVYTYWWHEDPVSAPNSLSNYSTQSVGAFPQVSTTYTVEAINSLNCMSTPETISIQVFTCTGIEKQNQENHQVVFSPNPVEAYAQLRAEHSDIYKLELWTIDGRMIYESKQGCKAGEIWTFDFSWLEKGSYWISVTLERDLKIQKPFLKF